MPRDSHHSTTGLRCRPRQFVAQLCKVVCHAASTVASIPRDDTLLSSAGKQAGHWSHRGDSGVDRRNDRRRLGLPTSHVTIMGIGTELIERCLIDFIADIRDSAIASCRVTTTTSRQANGIRILVDHGSIHTAMLASSAV